MAGYLKDGMARKGLVKEDAFDRRYWKRSIKQPTRLIMDRIEKEEECN